MMNPIISETSFDDDDNINAHCLYRSLALFIVSKKIKSNHNASTAVLIKPLFECLCTILDDPIIQGNL